MQKLPLKRQKGTETSENGVEGNFIAPGGWAGSYVAREPFTRVLCFFALAEEVKPYEAQGHCQTDCPGNRPTFYLKMNKT